MVFAVINMFRNPGAAADPDIGKQGGLAQEFGAFGAANPCGYHGMGVRQVECRAFGDGLCHVQLPVRVHIQPQHRAQDEQAADGYDPVNAAAQIDRQRRCITDHPGGKMVMANDEKMTHLIGGELKALPQPKNPNFGKYVLTPREVRAKLAATGWDAVVAFQTRNPLHRAHEYALVYGLESLLKAGKNAGAVLNPLIGETKGDDVSAEIRMQTYEKLIDGRGMGEGDTACGITCPGAGATCGCGAIWPICGLNGMGCCVIVFFRLIYSWFPDTSWRSGCSEAGLSPLIYLS